MNIEVKNLLAAALLFLVMAAPVALACVTYCTGNTGGC
jgi:hypothetical protein